jgi:plasmid segregation protein ParM
MSETFNVKAIDDGYGDIKYDSKGSPVLMPSFVTTFKPKPANEFDTSSNLQYIASEVNGERFVVGDYAIKIDPNIRWVGGENKHADKRFPVLLKTALGLMSSGGHELVDTLMMNLPIKYDTPERRKFLSDIVVGTHEVGISTDGKNFHQKIVTVDNLDIKKQPFGSVCDLILDQNGALVDKEMAKGFNVVADIGAGTLNVLTVEALEEQPELCTQTNDGMYSSYLQVGEYLERELRVTIPDGKLPQIIKAGEIRGRDITPLIMRAYENQANNIMNILDRTLINSWAFVNNLIFTGGGASPQLLQPFFAKALEHRGGFGVHYLDRYANVRGLRKYGIRQAHKHKQVTAARQPMKTATKIPQQKPAYSSKGTGAISINLGGKAVRR